jgi:hypothetical protein
MNRSLVLCGAALSCAAAICMGATPPAAGDPVFSATLPASGRHETTANLDHWGRYSLRSSGELPTALSVADRRNGILKRDGEPGQRHGRIDLFLDLGEYKLAVQGPKRASGNVTVTAVPFSEASGAKPLWLKPLRDNRFELDDLRQASFWFEVPSDTVVWLEAAGRNLAEMALWRDGEWRVPVQFRPFVSRPSEGTPWNGFAGGARLAKGLYMVGVYGGEARAWSEKVGEHPGYLRLGLEDLGAGARNARVMPPQGYEEFLLAPGVATVLVEEAEKSRLAAEITRLDRDYAPAGWVSGDSIFGKSASPRMLFHPGEASPEQGGRVLKVRGAPGLAYTVQTSGPSARTLAGREAREWRVVSQHSGNPADQIGASGIVVDHKDGSLVAVAADTVGSKEVARRFNLLEPVSAFIWIAEAGKYTLAPGGVKYRWSLGRYFHYAPPDYAPPEMAEGAKTLQLNAGLHRLAIEPAEKGIATFVLGKASLLGGMIAAGKAAVGLQDGRAWDPPRPEVRFDRIAVAKDASYDVRINSQAPELASVSARPLPLDPDEPVGQWLRPGERVDLPLKLAGKRILAARDAAGNPVPFDAAGRRADGPIEASGNLTVTLAGSGAPRMVFLSALPPERSPSGPAPEFPDASRAAWARFPVLEPGKPVWLDLARGGDRTYALKVAQPGLYRVESTGRLETALQLADRFRNFVREAQANGVGRNALVLEYLLPGEYQIRVSAQGQTAGRLGLSAARSAWVEAGALEPGIDNRAFVEAFAGAAYSVRLSAAGRYRFESQGLNGNHELRLEDKDGWPVETASAPSPRTLAMARGEYRLFSLPAPQEGRRVARLAFLADKRAIKGKGPHALPLNSTLASTWMDEKAKPGSPSGDTSQAPAIFDFALPAPLTARLSVSNGFKAALYRNGDGTGNLKGTPGGGDSALLDWTGIRKVPLPMGAYRIRVLPEKRRNLAPYQVGVSTRELVPGLAYALAKRETFAVRLGAPSIVEFGSQGMLDVTATLLAEDGKTVLADNDDGYLDWNFSISRALPAGRYFLRVASAEPGFSRTSVFMRALTDTLMETLPADGKPGLERRLGPRLAIFPLAAGPGDIVACAARGRSRIGLSLEKSAGGDAWIPVAQDGGTSPSVSVPRSPGAAYRLKAWSETNADDPVTVDYRSAAARIADARQAASGLSGQSEALGGAQRAWFKVDLGPDAPGHFRSVSEENPLAGLAVSTALDGSFDADDGAEFSSLARYAWIELRFDQAGRFRVKLEPVALGAAPLSLALDGGRPRVVAARHSANSVGWLQVTTDGAHPLAGPLANGPGPRFRLRGVEAAMAVWMGEGTAATASLPGDSPAIAVWNAAPAGDGTRPSARLAWSDLPLADGGTAAPGITEWSPGKPSARMLRLPGGSGLRLRVTLPPKGAALLRHPDGTRELECGSEGETIAREFRARGGDLYLLALDGKARFEVAALAAPKDTAAKPLSLGAGRGFDFPSEGLEQLPVGAEKPAGLFYRGAGKAVAYVGADGRLWPDMPNGGTVGPGGFLAIGHGAGKVRIDLCDATSPAAVLACKWGATLSPSGSDALARSSLSPLRDGVNWFSFALKDTQHVNLAVPSPMAALLLKEGAPFRYQEAWDRFNWDLPLPPGRYDLGIRPFAGASLEGASLAGLFRPIPTVSETHPFTTYLGPGESRLLRFDVARKAEFGIGLRMGRETVEARLYDSAGRVAAQGKQQFAKLAPGAYHLWMRVPEGSEGTEVTALVFGQEAPPNEPPERLVKWIVQGAQGERPATQTEQAAEPDAQRPEWERLIRRGGYSGAGEGADGEGGGEGAARAEEDGSAAPEGGDEGGPDASAEAGEGDAGGSGQGEGDAGNGESEGE